MKLSQFPIIKKNLFWDMNFSELELETDAFSIIKRIILKGGRKERLWMFENFDKNKIKEVVLVSREIPNHLKTVYVLAIDNDASS